MESEKSFKLPGWVYFALMGAGFGLIVWAVYDFTRAVEESPALVDLDALREYAARKAAESPAEGNKVTSVVAQSDESASVPSV